MSQTSPSWIFHHPQFEYRAELEKDMTTFAWIGHINFGYDLVANIRPKVIVELGTHWGVSFFSFAQAAKDHSPTSHLTAVDTWQGEEHAGFYGEEVIKKVRKVKEKYFGNLHINLLRKTFDEARNDFADKSIDLLHIDGLHTYEAVRHDFENWLPKMKDSGIILFHDTAEKERGFGVYRLWQELSDKTGQAVELPHCHGLGVLFLDKQMWQEFASMKLSWQAYYPLMYEKDQLARQSSILIAEQTKQLERLNKLLAETNDAVSENMKVNQELRQAEAHVRQLESALNSITNSKFYKLWSGYTRLKPVRGGKNA